MITKLDVLGGQDKIKICNAYAHKGEVLDEFPTSLKILAECEPVYESLPGWPEYSEQEWIEIAEKGIDALPQELISYVEYLEKATKTPAEMISLGPSRAATIYKDV